MAASLSSQYNFIIHWIPSHIKELSLGWHNIPGSDRADALANTAREKSMEMGDIEYIQEYDIIYIIWGRIRKYFSRTLGLLFGGFPAFEILME